jgi:hypothetical protein
MSSPQPYVWGSSDRSRLGNASDPRYGLAVRSRRPYIDTPARLEIGTGGMTWGENLQRDLVDAFQATSGTESARAKDLGLGAENKEQGGGRRAGVVEMVVGGWSFAARDQDGAVYVWGKSSLLPFVSHQEHSILIERSIRRREIRIWSTWMAG